MNDPLEELQVVLVWPELWGVYGDVWKYEAREIGLEPGH